MKKILKHAYRLIPFKHVFLRGLRKIWLPPRKVYQHLYFKGNFKVPVDKERFFRMKHYGYQLENDIFWSGIAGAWERNSLDIWMKLSSRAKVIFDIGANTGIYSLLAKSVNNSAEVYAFEPVKRVYKKLVDNCKMNGYDIHCYDMAVSNKEGSAVIYDSDMEHEYTASLIYKNNKGYTTSEEIQTVTLDKFISDNRIKQVDLVKIDAEAHEPAVLEGFKESIRFFKPAIVIELLDDLIGKEVETLVSGMGYLYYRINEQSGLEQVTEIVNCDEFNFLICSRETAAFLKLDAK